MLAPRQSLLSPALGPSLILGCPGKPSQEMGATGNPQIRASTLQNPAALRGNAGSTGAHPPPLSRGSGAVVEPQLLDPGAVARGAEEQLNSHIQRKRLQLLWGLPHLVQSSLQRAAPELPGYLACTALREAPSPQRPLFKSERRLCLEHHLREKLVHRKWGLPKRIQRSLCSAVPPVLQAEAQQRRLTPPRLGTTGQSITAAVPVCPAEFILPEGGNAWRFQRTGPGPGNAEEPWASVSSYLPILGEQHKALLPSERGTLGRDWAPDSLESSCPCSCAWRDFQGLEKPQSSWRTIHAFRPSSSLQQVSLIQASHLKMEPGEVTGSSLKPAGASPKELLMEGKVALEQDKPLVRQLMKWLENRNTQEGPAAGPQAPASPAHRELSLAWVSPTGDGELALGFRESVQRAGWSCSVPDDLPYQTNPVAPLGEALGGQSPAEGRVGVAANTCKSQGDEAAVARPGCRKAKAFLADDKKQYLEFHLREKLLQHRWGVPRRVEESMAGSVLSQSTRK